MANLGETARLSGENGTYRSSSENVYRAANDLEALHAWIESVHQRNLSRGTLETYTREAERFMLWALLERKMAMSSIKPEGFIEYENFLAAPPDHWKSKAPVRRLSVPWRPMRGPLHPKSIVVALTVVRMLFRDWLIAGYLSVDSARGHQLKAQAHSIHWLTTRDWQLIESRLKAHAHDISARRTRAAILLMRRCYLSPRDVVSLRFESLIRSETPVPGFSVHTRGSTLRPIDYETWSAIEAHFADRVRLIAETSLGRFDNVPDALVPLIGAVTLAGVREVAVVQPIYAHEFASKPNVIGSISQLALTRSVWSFFERISHEATGEEATTFLSRARSWLRDPSRQTPERRKKILLDKALGNVTHEFIDEPKQEELELRQLFLTRARII